jgi:N-acetylmuramoyl-L-alanine amidase
MLNVRSEPNQSAAKLGVLNAGTEVDLVEEVGDWSKIKFDGQLGYVKTEYTVKQ